LEQTKRGVFHVVLRPRNRGGVQKRRKLKGQKSTTEKEFVSEKTLTTGNARGLMPKFLKKSDMTHGLNPTAGGRRIKGGKKDKKYPLRGQRSHQKTGESKQKKNLQKESLQQNSGGGRRMKKP